MQLKSIKNNKENKRFEILQRNNLIGYTCIKLMTSRPEIYVLNIRPSWEVNVSFNTCKFFNNSMS